jgi:hypothetical protein
MHVTSVQYLTPPEIGRCLHVKAAKVIGWIRRGELVGIDVAERGAKRPRWRVAHDDLQAFLALRSTHQKPAAPVVRRRRVQAPFVDYFPTKKVLVAK